MNIRIRLSQAELSLVSALALTDTKVSRHESVEEVIKLQANLAVNIGGRRCCFVSRWRMVARDSYKTETSIVKKKFNVKNKRKQTEQTHSIC